MAKSLMKRAHVHHERSDLIFCQLLSECGHLAATMLDGINKSLIINSLLPLWIGEVGCTNNRAVVISGAVLTVALAAFLFEHSFRFFSFGWRYL